MLTTLTPCVTFDYCGVLTAVTCYVTWCVTCCVHSERGSGGVCRVDHCDVLCDVLTTVTCCVMC